MSTNPSVNQKSKFVKIGEASHILGVSIDTLRRWEKAGKIETMRTPGGTRLYKVKSLTKFQTKFEAKHARRIQRVSTIAAVASAQAEENALLQASSLEFPPISTEPQVSEDITPSIVETAPVVEDDHSIFHEMFSSKKLKQKKKKLLKFLLSLILHQLMLMITLESMQNMKFQYLSIKQNQYLIVMK